MTERESLFPFTESVAKARRALAFSKSALASGEPYTDQAASTLADGLAAVDHLESVVKGMGAHVCGVRCYRRPDSKIDPDPGPCGKCAACLARRAYYGTAE